MRASPETQQVFAAATDKDFVPKLAAHDRSAKDDHSSVSTFRMEAASLYFF